MRRIRLLAFGCVSIAILGGGVSLMLAPHLRMATRAQIEAALPAVLKIEDPVDRAARVRYSRLRTVVGDGKDPAKIPLVAALLDEGPIQIPEHHLEENGRDVETKLVFLKTLAAHAQAAAKGDQATASREALLGLRYSEALFNASRSVWDALAATAIESRAVDAVIAVDQKGGLTPEGRAAILAATPVEDGTSPVYARAYRGELRDYTIPTLLDPKGFMTGQWVSSDGHEPIHGELVGSYDALVTTRLVGQIYEGAVQNAGKRFADRDPKPLRLADEAQLDLPELSMGIGEQGLKRAAGRFWYRYGMKSTPNSIGRTMVASLPIQSAQGGAARRAALRNLMRAALLLRAGQTVHIPDPFAKGELRVDAKKGIVWSVGQDGKDDGGKIGGSVAGWSDDLGMRYR